MDESNSTLNKSLTPIKFPGAFNSKSKSDDILPRLEIILQTIHTNQLKWDLSQKRGLSLCTSIEAIKCKVFETTSESEITTYYPEELQPYCDKLGVILTIFEDILKSTKEFLKQLTALQKLNKNPDEIFFRTWKIENFFNFLKNIVEMYELEIEMKRTITTQIAHSKTRYEIFMRTSCWEFPEFVNEDFNLLFSFFRLEIQNLLKTS